MKPLCVDLYGGLGGWAEGFLSEGWIVIGFDIERHDYGTGGYPGQLVLQDVLTLHGSQFRAADCIVASPPCQGYSYRAMPWKRAKALPPPDNTLFDACFRIQREASEAAGRYIPMVVENVRGAQKWVGSAKWHFGSYYLWGDVPAIMPFTGSHKNSHIGGGSWFIQTTGVVERNNPDGRKANPDGTAHPPGSWFKIADSKERGSKGIPHRTTGHWTNPAEHEGVKAGDRCIDRATGKWMVGWNVMNAREFKAASEGVKQHGSGREWFAGEGKISRMTSSKSDSRRAASSMIAKIPFPLAAHIARCFYPLAPCDPLR